ncbi:MAG: succinate dehydrogenase assembly factor 2, partial [Burkholderiaceae bacterium]
MSGRAGIGEVELRRLRWRARRGLLENDILIGRFLDREAGRLDADDLRALDALLAKHGAKIDVVVRLEVDEQALIERVAKRFAEEGRAD